VWKLRSSRGFDAYRALHFGWLVGYLACLSRVSCGTDCAELVQVDLARDVGYLVCVCCGFVLAMVEHSASWFVFGRELGGY